MSPISEVVLFLSVFFLGLIFWHFAGAALEDAERAYKGTHRGDRWRLFCYYTIARYYSVPEALLRYGIKS